VDRVPADGWHRRPGRGTVRVDECDEGVDEALRPAADGGILPPEPPDLRLVRPVPLGEKEPDGEQPGEHDGEERDARCVLGLTRARSAERNENGGRGTEHEWIEGLVPTTKPTEVVIELDTPVRRDGPVVALQPPNLVLEERASPERGEADGALARR